MVDYSRQINPMDVGSYVQQGFEQGRQRGHATYLNRLAGEAYAAPPEQRQGYLAKLIGADAQTGTAMAAHLEQGDDARRKRQADMLVQGARIMSAMTPEQRAQAWPTLKQRFAGADPELASMLPDVYDDASFGPMIAQLAGISGPEQKVIAPGAAVWDGNRVVFTNPAAPSYSPYQIGDGTGGSYLGFYNNRNPADVQFPFGGPQGAPSAPPAPGNYADVQSTLDAIGQKYGFRTTSTVRTRAENDSLPGSVSNSQHLAENGGTARDFSIQGKSPQEVAAMVAELQAAGFEVITNDHGTAPHIHAELPPGGGGGGSMPRMGYTPPKPSTAGPAVTLSPAEVEAMGFPQGSVIQRKPDGSLVKVHSPTERDINGGKALPGNVVTQLTGDAEKLNTLTDLEGSFRDDYAGNVVGGSVENFFGRLGAERVGLTTQGQSTWWQQYDRYKNVIRNELFGSALTPSEQAAFEAADITPNMDPGVIRSNLERQRRLVESVLSRRAAVWEAQGYNPSAVTAATRAGSMPSTARSAADLSDDELKQQLGL